MVDKIGGLTVLPEFGGFLSFLMGKRKIHRFKKPYPSREISLIYYKPTYKQKILDELVNSIKNSLKPKLNYTTHPEDFFVNISPQ